LNGLKSGVDGLKIIMMCELPTNALLADEYSTTSMACRSARTTLTQLTLDWIAIRRIVAKAFDERDEAVKILLAMAISACKRRKKYVGICGQGPSDHPSSRTGCRSRESRACRSTRIRWLRLGCSWHRSNRQSPRTIRRSCKRADGSGAVGGRGRPRAVQISCDSPRILASDERPIVVVEQLHFNVLDGRGVEAADIHTVAIGIGIAAHRTTSRHNGRQNK